MAGAPVRGEGMRQTFHLFATLAALSVLLVSAGCVQSDLGWAPPYLPGHQDKLPVVMPKNAPSISQQYFRDPAGGGHWAIDILEKIGYPVIAAAPGQVVDSFFEPAYGNRITIDHGPDAGGRKIMTVYMHLASRAVSAGQRVERGQKIATLGNTGALAGGIPHLHFEVYREVRPVEQEGFAATYPVPCR